MTKIENLEAKIRRLGDIIAELGIKFTVGLMEARFALHDVKEEAKLKTEE